MFIALAFIGGIVTGFVGTLLIIFFIFFHDIGKTDDA